MRNKHTHFCAYVYDDRDRLIGLLQHNATVDESNHKSDEWQHCWTSEAAAREVFSVFQEQYESLVPARPVHCVVYGFTTNRGEFL